jgi:hypothetical protein
MLADVVALLLAFFVLSFSMRELDPVDHQAPLERDTVVAPAALGAVETAPSDQLRAIERPAASLPSFTYLTALILDAHETLGPDQLDHDDAMLTVELPGDISPETDSELARLLLTLAFLARRFDLELAVDLPADQEAGLEARVERSLALRTWLAEATGSASGEVTFLAAAEPPARPERAPARARLAVKAASGEQLP